MNEESQMEKQKRKKNVDSRNKKDNCSRNENNSSRKEKQRCKESDGKKGGGEQQLNGLYGNFEIYEDFSKTKKKNLKSNKRIKHVDSNKNNETSSPKTATTTTFKSTLNQTNDGTNNLNDFTFYSTSGPTTYPSLALYNNIFDHRSSYNCHFNDFHYPHSNTNESLVATDTVSSMNLHIDEISQSSSSVQLQPEHNEKQIDYIKNTNQSVTSLTSACSASADQTKKVYHFSLNFNDRSNDQKYKLTPANHPCGIILKRNCNTGSVRKTLAATCLRNSNLNNSTAQNSHSKKSQFTTNNINQMNRTAYNKNEPGHHLNQLQKNKFNKNIRGERHTCFNNKAVLRNAGDTRDSLCHAKAVKSPYSTDSLLKSISYHPQQQSSNLNDINAYLIGNKNTNLHYFDNINGIKSNSFRNIIHESNQNAKINLTIDLPTYKKKPLRTSSKKSKIHKYLEKHNNQRFDCTEQRSMSHLSNKSEDVRAEQASIWPSNTRKAKIPANKHNNSYRSLCCSESSGINLADQESYHSTSNSKINPSKRLTVQKQLLSRIRKDSFFHVKKNGYVSVDNMRLSSDIVKSFAAKPKKYKKRSFVNQKDNLMITDELKHVMKLSQSPYTKLINNRNAKNKSSPQLMTAAAAQVCKKYKFHS